MGLAQLIADTLTNICRPLQAEGFVAKGHGHYTIYAHTHCLIVTEYLIHMYSWCLFVPKKILSNDVMCQKLKYSFLWSTTGTVSTVDLCQVSGHSFFGNKTNIEISGGVCSPLGGLFSGTLSGGAYQLAFPWCVWKIYLTVIICSFFSFFLLPSKLFFHRFCNSISNCSFCCFVM